MFLIYYSILGLVFLVGASHIDEDITTNININTTGVDDSEIDTGGLFNTGVSFSRFLMFISFGIGLPSSTPIWFSVLYGIWQTIITILALGFIISSIWNG